MWEPELQQGWVVRRRVPRRLSQKGNQQNRTDSGPRSRPTGPTQVCHLTPLPGTVTFPSQAPQRPRPGTGGVPVPGGAVARARRLEAWRRHSILCPGLLLPVSSEKRQHRSRGFQAPRGASSTHALASPQPPRRASPGPGSAIPGRTHLRA